MKLRNTTRAQLLDYVAAQLDHLFPDHHKDGRAVIERSLDTALERMRRCVNGVAMWREEEFDYLHSSQYCVFLYYLANTIWRDQQHEIVCTKLFYLNKALHGFECFYQTELPEVFFVGHTVGIVLVRTTYGNHFAIYQNCTVGQSKGARPEVGDRVLMFPNSAILGASKAGDGTVLAQGAALVDRDTPRDTIVFGRGREATFGQNKRDLLGDIFRI
jgi:serine O-acetyltransferase